MEEEKELSVSKLREGMEEILREANNIRYEVRFSHVDEDDVIEVAKEFAFKIDDFIDLVVKEDEDFYNSYREWFNRNYDDEISYGSRMIFKEIEFSGLNSKKDRAMKYFNYLVKSMVMINNLIMSMEFNELHNECSIVVELKE